MSTGPHALNTPLVLIIRDGWGENPHREHDAFNAVRLAKKPVDDRLRRDWPGCLIRTGGLDVGVPADQTGNSEVGHQNIGAGRIVDQEVVRITKACAAGELAKIHAIEGGIREAVGKNATVHLMGIASDAGVHGLLEHLYALLRTCKQLGASKVAVHLFTDGRDTPPTSGAGFVRQVQAQIDQIGVGTIASVAGRYWAMDRDFRWERVGKAYAVLTGRGENLPRASSAVDAVEAYYQSPLSATQTGDEFVTPTMIGPSDQACAQARIRDGDTVIFYNYRGDRPRELSMAFVLPDELWAKVKPSPESGRVGFDRGERVKTWFVAMTAWAESLTPHLHVAFIKPPKLRMIGGEYLSSLGLRQFRCAETEKYPHVTFFFNDYREEPFAGERRENPPSKQVATYDLAPEMSAAEVEAAVLRRLADRDCEEVLVVNFANGDMVGHTGSLPAAVRAVETVDACVGRIIDATLARGGSLIVTADHGNCEQMFDPEHHCPHTAHTLYDVPLHVVGAAFQGRTLRGGFDRPASERGRLADVFPTALAMMGLKQPAEMTGQSLLV